MNGSLRALRHVRVSPALAIAVVAWLLAACVLVWRLPVGAAATDEAFYSAMTYGFLLGNKPYLDELAIHQNAAILLMPAYRAYVWLHGTDSIILFNRSLYVVYIGFASWLSCRLVTRFAGKIAGCWAGALVISFSYYNLLALSYNTFGAFGLLCGVLYSTLAFFEKPRRNLFVASVFFITAVFSYPTLIFVVALQLPLVTWRLHQVLPKPEFRRAAMGLAFGIALGVVLATAFVIWVTPAGIERALEYSRSVYEKIGLVSKFQDYRGFMFAQRWHWLGFASLFIAFPLALTRLASRARLVAALASVAFASLYFTGLPATFTTHVAVFQSLLFLLAAVCLRRARAFPQRRLLAELVWLPGLMSMLIFAYTSANGVAVAYLGALPSIVALVTALAKLAEEVSSKHAAGTGAASFILSIFCAAVLGCELHNLGDLAYSFPAHVRDNDTRVTAGPFKGALGGEPMAGVLAAVDADLKRIEEPGKTLAVFDSFSVAYLATRMRPRTFTHWVVWAFDPEYVEGKMAATYGNPATQPDFVLLIGTGLRRHHPWQRFAVNYEPILIRPDYRYVIMKRLSAKR